MIHCPNWYQIEAKMAGYVYRLICINLLICIFSEGQGQSQISIFFKKIFTIFKDFEVLKRSKSIYFDVYVFLMIVFIIWVGAKKLQKSVFELGEGFHGNDLFYKIQANCTRMTISSEIKYTCSPNMFLCIQGLGYYRQLWKLWVRANLLRAQGRNRGPFF